MASDSERKEKEHSWCELPADLLEFIFKKVRLISDCIRFRAVCKSWRLASQPTAASSLQPQLPLLILLPYHPSTDSCSFFTLSTNSIHTLSLPKVRGKQILASSHGWLLLVGKTTRVISLLNPITEAQIQLPRLPTCHGPINWTGIRGGSLPSISGVISSSPSSAHAEHNDCVVITLRYPPWAYYGCDVNFCRPGRDEVWTKLMKTPLMLVSIVYNKGRFYMLDGAGVVSVYDIAAPSVEILSLRAPAFALENYLVKASETELLWCGYFCLSSVEKIVRLFKMDLNGQLLQWSEIDSIGDKALFLTREKCSCLMVCARDLPGCEEDRVYYETPFNNGDFPHQNHSVQVIKIKDWSYELIRCPLEKPLKNLMVPTWFTPSLY